jgi:hypothetical protein
MLAYPLGGSSDLQKHLLALLATKQAMELIGFHEDDRDTKGCAQS